MRRPVGCDAARELALQVGKLMETTTAAHAYLETTGVGTAVASTGEYRPDVFRDQSINS